MYLHVITQNTDYTKFIKIETAIRKLQTHAAVWLLFPYDVRMENKFSISGGVNVKRADFLSCFLNVVPHNCKIIKAH
jgi:hypothetical protein